MQEVSGPLSAFPTTPSGRSPGGSPFEAALDGAVTLSARLRSTPRTYLEAGDLSPRPSMGVMWQEVEDITCSLVRCVDFGKGSTVICDTFLLAVFVGGWFEVTLFAVHVVDTVPMIQLNCQLQEKTQ